MHRSGTSAVTRTLNLLGAALPGDMMPAGPDNELGFWESQSLMKLHERLLGAASTSWDGLTPIPRTWYDSDTAVDFKNRLRAFVERQFESQNLLVLKDPRISLFVPLWLEALRDAEIEPLPVLVLRNPLEVNASLAKRNGFSPVHGFFLWLRYMLEAEEATRSMRRSLVRFDAILEDWQTETRRILSDLGLAWPSIASETEQQIESFLSPGHRHHFASTHELAADHLSNPWIFDAFRHLLRLADDPHDTAACRGLDEIRSHFTTAERIFVPLVSEGLSRTNDSQEAPMVPLNSVLADLRSFHRQEIHGLQTKVDSLVARLDRRTTQRAANEERLRTGDEEAGRLRSELTRTRHQLHRWVRKTTRLAGKLRAAASDPIRTAHGTIKRIRLLVKWLLPQLGIDLPARRLYRLIGDSGLFDPDYYAEQLPPTDRGTKDLLWHFVTQGSREGLRPNPLFDPAFYLRQNLDVAEAGIDPLAHYISYGSAQDKNPSPLFDTRYYCDLYSEVIISGENPLAHYLRVGDSEARRPHPLFDVDFYVAEHPEVAHYRVNPLIHYLRHGVEENLRPNPFFDAGQYRKDHPNVDRSKITPLEHLAEFGSWSALPIDPRPAADDSGLSAPTDWHLLADSTTIDRNAKLSYLLNEFENVVSDQPDVSLVIPVFNQLDLTVHCLWSLGRFRNETAFEVLVVNDQSTDETREVLQLIPGLKLLDTKENSGFVVSCNLGAEEATGEHLVFLNNDTAVLDDWLDELVGVFRKFPEAGYVSSKLLYPDNTLQEAGCVVWEDGSAWNIGRNGDPSSPEFNYLRDTHYGSGCSFMTPVALFQELGGFDLELKPGYYEDIDYAYKVRAADRRVLYQPKSQLIHFEGRTGGTDLASGAKKHQTVNRERFRAKWVDALAQEAPETTPLYKVDCKGADRHVLFIEPTLLTPDRDAGSAMSFNLIRALVQMRMKVTFVASENFVYDSRYTDSLQREGVECLYRPYYESLTEVFAARPDAWDLIFIARLHCISEVFDEVREANPSAKLVYQTIDLSSLRERRELELGLFAGSKAEVDAKEDLELTYIEACDQSIIVSSFEKDLLAERGLGDKVASMPLLSYDYPEPALGARQGIMFIGGFRHRPNVDAVRFLAEEIAPHVLESDPSLIFYIVGGDVPDELRELNSPNILFMGQIQNPDSFFLGMRLSIAPLRYGAGIKGKVIQSISAGLPCVGTTLAVEGIGSAEETGVWIADEAYAFAQGILRLSSDDEAWRKAARRGYQFARERYAPQALARDVEKFVKTFF
jgi:GT2 family glycosyltransferase